jgi:hypothetical protein
MQNAPKVGAFAKEKSKGNTGTLRPSKSRSPAQELIAEIDKSHSSRLRISLTEWHGERKVEIRECSATIPGIYFPTSAGVTIPLEKLPELIAALEAVRP